MGYDISIMRYSPDLRKRVLDFIQAGGSKTEAAKRFNVGRTTIYKWLNAPDPFAYQRPGPRGPRSIDYDALKQHMIFQTRPSKNALFSCIGIYTRKKRRSVIRNEKRQAYRQQLEQVKVAGKSVVYADETFETTVIDGMAMRL